ncbi:hypothetical protein BKI52_01930 [marine bacterium AO1-C]|nr:hypothetical protein BKI52_01930 [marine bacterium AO1-C]
MPQKTYLLTIVFSLLVLTSYTQGLRGWVKIHQDTTKPIYEILVKDKDKTNSQVWQKKQSQQKLLFQPLMLAVGIQMFQNDKKVASTPSDDLGNFIIKDIPAGVYTLKLFTYVQLQYSQKITIDPKSQIIEISINATAFEAHWTSLLLKDVPYNKAKARQDIAKGIVQLLDLRSSHVLYSWSLPHKYIKVVEEKYGFQYTIKHYDVGKLFLNKAQKAYNAEVYAFLDEKYNIDSKKVIWKAFRERYRQFMMDVKKENEERGIQEKKNRQKKQDKSKNKN